MKRFVAPFEVVDGQTGHRYLPGELIVIDETDERWKDILPLLGEVTEESVPVVTPDGRADVVIPSPVADLKDTKSPRD